jgi:hypothetical protein
MRIHDNASMKDLASILNPFSSTRWNLFWSAVMMEQRKEKESRTEGEAEIIIPNTE